MDEAIAKALDEWFCFGAMENFHTMIHLKTGRVFRWIRQDRIELVASSFRDYWMGFADDLWNDVYALHGDPALPGVTEEGFIYLKRYLAPA